MDYTSIERQIITKADEDLKAEIRLLVDQLDRLVEDHYKPSTTEITYNGKVHTITLPHQGMLLPLISDLIFQIQRDKRRKKALNNFLHRFEQVVSQVEALGVVIEELPTDPE